MNKLKITLLRPNYHSHLVTPPLGLGYLSSYLKGRGCDINIIDGLNLNYSIGKIINQCKGSDIIGINCLSAYFLEVVELTKQLKKLGYTIVIGGAHASALPELTLKETQADYIVIGEGELSFFQLVDAIENDLPVDGIMGIATRRNIGTIQKSPLIENLDSLPYPDWKQINPATYKKAPHGGLVKSFPVAPIISTRGCPFECTFCSSPFLWGRTIRFRSPENVVGEIEYLIDEFKVREIHFEDDNLTLKREHIEGICNIILKRNIKINWATPNGVRADTLDWGLLRLMKESGCYSLAFGIESGNQEILNRIKKKTNLKTIERTVRLAKKLGIVTQGFFIFGLPGETEKTIQETIDFAKRLPLDKAQFLILDILPGSELWDGLRRGQVVNWNYKSYQEVTWVPEGLDGPRLRRSVRYAFRSFFFRPRQMLFLLKYFKLGQTPFIIKRIIDFNIFSFSKH
jgi:radical SAM superfamily enzyme YgiQ (UPF0313 family)